MLPGYGDLSLVLSDTVDNEYYQLLKQKLRAYNRRAALRMEPPEAVPLNIWVENRVGHIVGGLAALTYWDWLVVKLLVLDDELRGNGLGHHLIQQAHAAARRRGCTRAQTATYDFQALQFYQKHGYRIVGTLTDYPNGYDYYWLRKDFEEDDGSINEPQATAGSDSADGYIGL